MNANIAGKTIVITGGSSGMGAAAARHLAREGAEVDVNEILFRPTAQDL